MSPIKPIAINEIVDVPSYCVDYLRNLRVVRNLSPLTVRGYYTDLRTFFRYLVFLKGTYSLDEFHIINASDVSLDEFKRVTISTLYDFQSFCMDTLANDARARARKISSLRGFYKYLISQKIITENPTVDLRPPKAAKDLPHYLSINQSANLLNAVDGRFQMRNLAIITLFVNCGIRLAELVGLNTTSIEERTMRVRGKGNKERILHLNDACIQALNAYADERRNYTFKIVDRDALFVSQKGTRISQRMVQVMVQNFMKRSGIDTSVHSVHKLRHTAATLMYQNGVDVRILQEILGHANLGTTQIYTHIKSSQVRDAMNSINVSADPTKD